MATFEVGLIYSAPSTKKKEKIYFVAIHEKTLVTHRNGRFGKFSSKKKGHSLESNISVGDLCRHWDIKVSKLDGYMVDHFSPDNEARERAKKSRDG